MCAYTVLNKLIFLSELVEQQLIQKKCQMCMLAAYQYFFISQSASMNKT
jgi:hypothetical protein